MPNMREAATRFVDEQPELWPEFIGVIEQAMLIGYAHGVADFTDEFLAPKTQRTSNQSTGEVDEWPL